MLEKVTKRKIWIGVGVLIAIFIAWYTLGALWNAFDQKWTQKWGGTMHITLSKGERVMNATWKEGNHLWVFVTQRPEGEAPGPPREFKEYSKYGVLQGSIIFKEK
jgi:hypothetical protein